MGYPDNNDVRIEFPKFPDIGIAVRKSISLRATHNIVCFQKQATLNSRTRGALFLNKMVHAMCVNGWLFKLFVNLLPDPESDGQDVALLEEVNKDVKASLVHEFKVDFEWCPRGPKKEIFFLLFLRGFRSGLHQDQYIPVREKFKILFVFWK